MPEASATEQENSTLTGLWEAVQWPCPDAKKSFCWVDAAIFPSYSNRWHSDDQSSPQRDEGTFRGLWGARSSQREGCGGRVRRSVGHEGLVLNSRFVFRSHDAKLAGRKTWCDADSSIPKIKAQSRIMSERRHVADAEQELYFTRFQLAEFLGFLVNDETV